MLAPLAKVRTLRTAGLLEMASPAAPEHSLHAETEPAMTTSKSPRPLQTAAEHGAPARWLAAALGLATASFGALGALVPGPFARAFGLAAPTDPTIALAYRSIGARDVATGLGLWSAAVHRGRYAPWLLARAICDGGDTIGALLAIAAGARRPRFVLLTALAAAATAADLVLWRWARASAPTRHESEQGP